MQNAWYGPNRDLTAGMGADAGGGGGSNPMVVVQPPQPVVVAAEGQVQPAVRAAFSASSRPVLLAFCRELADGVHAPAAALAQPHQAGQATMIVQPLSVHDPRIQGMQHAYSNQPMWQHQQPPVAANNNVGWYGPTHCHDHLTGRCSFRCFGITHMVFESIDCVAAFIGAYVWMLWSFDVWDDSYYSGSMQLSFNPLHFAAAILMTATSAAIACVCCCVGQEGVNAYKTAARLAAVLGFLRFCGACGFVVGLYTNKNDEECELEQFERTYAQDGGNAQTLEAPDHGYVDCNDPLSHENGDGGAIILLLPWAVWVGALFVMRLAGSECCAKRWTPPTTRAPQVAVIAPQQPVGGVIVASAHPEP